MLGVPPASDEPRGVRIDLCAGIRAQELEERAVAAIRSGGDGIERGKFLEDLPFFIGREPSAADVVDVLRTAGVHQQRAVADRDAAISGRGFATPGELRIAIARVR